ncbi:MAG TPA: CpsD/CapB family tyrosine-protein kinase, partial [Acidimicrobiales bacterium]|nr:CpsD/CapB family tyrosine-protein kinase [Acidimicrobiales bacterium]
YDGAPDELTSRLTLTPDAELGAVRMVVEANDEQDAVRLVNAFANQTLRYIQELDTKRLEEEEAAKDLRVGELQEAIAAVQGRIDAAGGDGAPGTASDMAERDRLTGELTAIGADIDTASTRWVSVEETTVATEQETSAVAFARGQWMLLAALVSVLLAFGVAIMLDRSDSRLHTKEAVERHFGLPVLAEVPLLPIRLRNRAAVHGYEHDHRVAEAYRSLRTALLLFRDRLPLEVEAAELSARQGRSGQPAASPRQVILVTSPEAGDGKSSTAANLAMAYAEAGQSVLLVNWDLWRPMAARVLEAEDAPGVSEFLEAGNASLVHFVQSTSVPGLHLVPAGKVGHQPGAQLDAELRLLEEARALADVVIIDTAPILAASVTRALVTMADVVVLACRAGRTTSPAADRTSELLERLGAPTLGVVLVGVATGLFNDYYGNQPSRADRLRSTVMGRGEPAHEPSHEPRVEPPAEPRAETRYSALRRNGADTNDIFVPPHDPPRRGPTP